MKAVCKYTFFLLIVLVFQIPAIAQSTSSVNLFKITLNNKYGFINNKGKVKIASKYDEAHDFSGRLAMVGLNNGNVVGGKRGFIDITGKQQIIGFDNADNFSDGLAPVLVNGKFGYIDNRKNYNSSAI